jgi:hypothetical protein
MQRFVPYLTLFSSFGTLICCALPALFVSLGMGAAVAATVSTIPQLIWLSEHKGIVFISAGGLILISGVLRHIAKMAPCPIDPALREACTKGRKASGVIFWISLFLYLIGGLFAYVAPLVMG